MYRDTCSPVYLLNIRIERPKYNSEKRLFSTDFSEDGVSVFQIDRDSVNPDSQTQSDVGRYFDTISCQPKKTGICLKRD